MDIPRSPGRSARRGHRQAAFVSRGGALAHRAVTPATSFLRHDDEADGVALRLDPSPLLGLNFLLDWRLPRWGCHMTASRVFCGAPFFASTVRRYQHDSLGISRPENCPR